jgi:hypothetical protein
MTVVTRILLHHGDNQAWQQSTPSDRTWVNWDAAGNHYNNAAGQHRASGISGLCLTIKLLWQLVALSVSASGCGSAAVRRRRRSGCQRIRCDRGVQVATEILALHSALRLSAARRRVRR